MIVRELRSLLYYRFLNCEVKLEDGGNQANDGYGRGLKIVKFKMPNFSENSKFTSLPI